MMWNDSEFAFTQEVGFSLKERLSNRLPDEEHKNNLKLDESRALQKNLVQKQSSLLTAEKTMKIGNNIFFERAKEDFATCFLDLQEELESKFEPTTEYSTFGSAWAGSYYSGDFINLLISFIKKQIKLRKTLSVGVKTSSTSYNASAKSFKCPCCGGQHLDKNNRPRNYLSVCTRFLELSVQQRIQFIRKQKLCMVCLSDAIPMNSDCRLLEKLNCNCINRDRIPHHKLLCLSQQSKVAYNASDSNGNNGRHGKKKNDRYYKSSDS